jgi:hypothetical protein
MIRFAALNGNRPQAFGLTRHEAKFVIPWDQVPAVREYIRPFCYPDPHATSDPPLYTTTTLQLDTPGLALCMAKEWESPHRFKLRARTYGFDGSCPVFLEVKRKHNGINLKSRACIPYEVWASGDWRKPHVKLDFKSKSQAWGFLEFRRLIDELGARPTILIRYERESYHGNLDRYARVTLDYRLRYRRAAGWDLLPTRGPWWSMDSQIEMNRPYAGVVLELKTYNDAPRWMIDMVREFSLVRTGFCKYFNAVRRELAFGGRELTGKLQYAPAD